MTHDALAPVHLPAVLDGLAKNRGLPQPLIRRLLSYRRGFGNVAMRGDLTGVLIAEIIATDDHWLLHSLALNQHLPHAVRLELAGHPDPNVRAALVFGGRDGGHDLFERLVDDPDTRVRDALAQTDTVPPDLRERLAQDPDPEVRATLARWWTQAPEHVRRTLLTDSAATVRAAACSTYYARRPHPVPPADLLARLLADPATRAGVVQHLDLTPTTARKLATDPTAKVREKVAAHQQLPPDLRELLATDPDAMVRVAIFARSDTPEPIREKIYTEIQQSRGPQNRDPAQDLQNQPDTETTLNQFADHLAGVQLRHLRLAWVSANPLPYLASPYVCFRRSAASSRALPPEAVQRLLNDEESLVRTTAARNAPHLVDLSTAERIDREYQPDKKTTWRPADDFTFPAQTLRRLASDPDPRMRRLAPRDPDLPPHLAQALACDPNSNVRETIAPHASLPTPELITLLNDPVAHVAHAAATSPTLPTTEMDRLLRQAGL